MNPKPSRRSADRVAPQAGTAGDWGRTQPFWCLFCGEGFPSVERVFRHYATAGHGNESASVGNRGLTKKQRTEAFRLMNK